MFLMFNNSVSITGTVIGYKEGTKTPSAKSGVVKHEKVYARISTDKTKIMLASDDEINVMENDVIVDSNEIIVDGEPYNEKFRVKTVKKNNDYPFRQYTIGVEAIKE